jgi:hypothetical protein
MKMDPARHDLQVTITADARRGLWAGSLFNGGGKAIRFGGKIGAEAHAHTLLLLALTNTLRSITRNEYDRIRRPAGVIKPRVQVLASGRGAVTTFADAFTGLLKNDTAAPRLRSGRNFLDIAAQQASRFSLDVQTLSDPRGLVLLTWVQQSMFPDKSFRDLPDVLKPQVTRQIVNKEL